MREAAADLRSKGDGAVVNISSLNAHRVIPARGVSMYVATKQALRALTDGYARSSPPPICRSKSPRFRRGWWRRSSTASTQTAMLFNR